MTIGEERLKGHEKYSELCALAMSGALTADESAELKVHLQNCSDCHEAYREYVVLTEEGIPQLASRYGAPPEERNWDDTAARRRLLARVNAAQVSVVRGRHAASPRFPVPGRIARHRYVATAAAGCIVLAVSVAAFWYGRQIAVSARQAVAMATISADDRVRKLISEKQAVDNLLSAQSQKLDLLQREGAEKQKEIESLRSELTALQLRANGLEARNAGSDEQLRSISLQRDALAAQLLDARRGYDAVRAELVGLRSERDRASSSLTSLEAQVTELSAMNRDLQNKASTAAQFLSSDRDIRELMGARNLYIADVFDVDSSSRTRKPFGRVFYTQGKSLIFYAFDLDRQPSPRNASAFQAWGQRETPQGESVRPVSLGILYLDNETNRRWALHCDDPQQLSEIDAVFVTVEPRGGSEKPTGKPFLFAMLRKEANHP